MNPSCPECQTELNDDFGIVTCTNCGAVCSVDFEGKATIQEKNETPGDEALSLEEDSSFEDIESEDFGDTHEEGSTFESENSFETDDLAGESFEGDEEFSEATRVEEFDDEEAVFDDTPEEALHTTADSGEELLDLSDSSSEGELDSGDVDSLEAQGSSEPLSASSFFTGLEVFTEQLEPMDHHHTYYQVKVSGFETKDDFNDVLDLTLDDRLGLTRESLNFDDTKQSFIIEKISFLRLVALYKRLSTLSFLEIEWNLSEDQTDVTESGDQDYDDDSTVVGDASTDENIEYEDDDTLYEEVEE